MKEGLKELQTVQLTIDGPLTWYNNYQMQGAASRGGRKLCFVVVPVATTGRWSLLAIETIEKPRSLDAILNDHAHKVIGDYETIQTAQAAGADYCANWGDGEASLVWTDTPQVQGFAIRGARRLCLAIVPVPNEKVWPLVALESDAGAKDAAALFDDHSHKEVGHYDSLEKAKCAGEAYLAAWESRIAEACRCEEIPARDHDTVDETSTSR